MKLWLTGFSLAFCIGAQPLAVQLPPFTREVLPNGVVLCLMPKADAPLVSVRVVVRGGAESDPPGLAGLSSVVVNLLTRGTLTHTAEEFAAEVDFLGASIHGHVNAESSSLDLEVLPTNATAALKLLASAILRPAFAEEEVRREVVRSIETARSRKNAAGEAIWQYFRSFFFLSPHPYGRPFTGDELTLGRIDRTSVARYYARTYMGRNLIVTAVGPFAAPALRATLVKAFGGLSPGKPYRWAQEPPPELRGRARWLLVDKPDATQTQFIVGFPGIGRAHPDRTALLLVNNILGGRFTSLLNEHLRVESGLTYGAYSYVQQDRLAGAIAIASDASTANTRRAVDLAFRVLRRFSSDGISADQLTTARTYIKAEYPPEHLQTAEQLADLLAELELYGLGRNEVDGLFARLDSVTVGEANRVLKKYYTVPNPAVVLIGRAEQLRRQLRGYTPTMMEASITEPGFPRQLQNQPASNSKR